MQITNKRLDEIRPYQKNPRKNDEAVEYVANSIREFGFKQPLVIDKDGCIVCGHTRYEAAKVLGLDEVPCVVADDLTDDQIKAYRLADNKVAEFSKWDKGLLNFELLDIDIDMLQFGFDAVGDEDEMVQRPEVPFTEVLGEEHNYIVLYFDNDIDWLQIASLLDIGEKKNLSTRRDGKIGKKMERRSVGRVFKGAEVLERLRKEYEHIH